MIDSKSESQESRQSALAPEMHNDEQDDHRSQAQEVAAQAASLTEGTLSPAESSKSANESGLMDDSTQDIVDHMRDMNSSGRIDMSAYRGEPNMDDDSDKYGESARLEEEQD